MIDDVVAIAFANQRIREISDQLSQTYYASKSLVNDWNYKNMASLLAPGDATILDDGSFTDGRSHITADDCYGIVLRAQGFIDDLEANNSAKLASVLKAATRGPR